MKPTHLVIALFVVVLSIVLGSSLLFKRALGQDKVSRFGEYSGYSEKVYNGTHRYSDFLTLSNGTRLAYDLIIPKKDGILSEEPLPVLFKYTPYLRTITIFDKDGQNIAADLFNLGWKERAMLRFRYWVYDRGHMMDPLFRTPWLENIIYHGYAAIVVERPGTGASFGVLDPSFETAASEANEILDWISAQEWCNGNIGMFGDSWEAQIQFAAAASGNLHLKAIFPTSSSIENYSSVAYPGGIYNKAFGSFFTWSTTFLESEVLTPVDSDENGKLLTMAREERRGSTVGEKSASYLKEYPYRDSINLQGSKVWEEIFALYPFIERINRFGVPVYMTNGWFDLFTRDMFIWFANLSVPKRMIVRPLDHSQVGDNQFDLNYGAEAHRWFDYWLKGIENGIMDEPSLHYYVMRNKGKGHWRSTDNWPLGGQASYRFYLAEGKTGSVDSLNDGFLTLQPPTEKDGTTAYLVDYSTSTGSNSRWNAINWPRNYPDMRPNDEKALTFTTPLLNNDLFIVGHPIVHLWIMTDAPDLDAFVYLESVDINGISTYVTEGALRASNRALSEASFNNIGLPYHTFYQSDLLSIQPGLPVEMVIDLLPTSYRFSTSSRIRITVAFSDADNFETLVYNPPLKVILANNAIHSSYIEIPILEE